MSSLNRLDWKGKMNTPLWTLSQLGNISGYLRFLKASKVVEKVQRGKLQSYLRNAQGTEVGRQYHLHSTMSYEELKKYIPVTDYSDWEELILKQKEHKKSPILSHSCQHFEPTSGSLSNRKWIPYTQDLHAEFNAAASAWLVDLFLRYPQLKKGRHYWSTSWLTNDLRSEKADINDLKIFPFWKRWIFEKIMAVPTEVSHVSTLEASMLASSVYLAACEDLTLLSIWSPTFIFSVLKNISLYRQEIASVLRRGSWGPWSEDLSELKLPCAVERADLLQDWDGKWSPEFLSKFWPSLALISAWGTSTSEIAAEEVKSLFAHAPFQGKGLWATEGVVTIPFRQTYPVAVTSHFYEFRDLQTQKIHPTWELRQDQVVQPLLTTGSGLWRYAMNDQVRVKGFFNQIPCLEFLGRLGGIDMVGEKLDRSWVESRLKILSRRHSIHCLTLLAYQIPSSSEALPYYCLLAQGPQSLQEKLEQQLETLLLESHHYRLARELLQLGKSRASIQENALEVYESLNSSMVSGSRKLESITLLKGR